MRAVLKRWWDSDIAWAWRRAPVANYKQKEPYIKP